MAARRSTPLEQDRPRRADARRNREAIIAAASMMAADEGAAFSLEAVARRAGVGSATLHRNFCSRTELLEVVYLDRVQALSSSAFELAAERDPAQALVLWLQELATFVSSTKGLGAALSGEMREEAEAAEGTQFGAIATACAHLVERARQVSAIGSTVTDRDLIRLVYAISIATEHEPDAPARAKRLLRLALDGLVAGSER
jgi:AcrR family transcriptional regulator